MASQNTPALSHEASQPVSAGGMRYLAREPIMDLRGHVHGYELLFRSGPVAFFSGDGDLATCTMLDNTLLFGLEKLAGGLTAFINCTNESLIERLVDVLPPSMTVLEIRENQELTPGLIDACRKLKAVGFRLALDDFVWNPQLEPLVHLADYIKVDFRQNHAAARKEMRKHLDGISAAMVAGKVETQEEYKEARAEGFTFFQGYYFCRPTLLENRKVPANRVSLMGILQLLKDESLNMRKMAQLMKREFSLTYRLLRLVNSPLYGARQEIRSIEAALLLVGENAFRRIAMLAITSELCSGQPVELLRMAFVRGRFCELGAALCALDSNEQYLLGMLSLLPAMLRVSMKQLTPLLPLREEVREALKGTANHERSLLQWLEYDENRDWEGCDAVVQTLGLAHQKLLECYTEAVVWTEDALRLAV